MSAGCPTCGDTLQGVMCEVPDHGEKRDLLIDWCMDCREAKRFTLGGVKPRPRLPHSAAIQKAPPSSPAKSGPSR